MEWSESGRRSGSGSGGSGVEIRWNGMELGGRNIIGHVANSRPCCSILLALVYGTCSQKVTVLSITMANRTFSLKTKIVVCG